MLCRPVVVEDFGFIKALETDIPAVFLAVGEEDLQKENLAKAREQDGSSHKAMTSS